MPLSLTYRASADGSGSGGITTPSFTPANGCLLVIVAQFVADNNALVDGTQLAITDSLGLTWTSRIASQATSKWGVGARIWTTQIVVGVSMTVTVTSNPDVAFRLRIQPIDVEGHDVAAPVGATGQDINTILNGADSLTLSAAPASTSVVLGVLTNVANSGEMTADPGAGFTERWSQNQDGWYLFQGQDKTGTTSTTVDWDDIALTGQSYESVILGIEFKEASSGYSVSATEAASADATGTAQLTIASSATQAATAGAAGTAQLTGALSATQAASAGGTATAQRTQAASSADAATAGATATTQRTQAASATQGAAADASSTAQLTLVASATQAASAGATGATQLTLVAAAVAGVTAGGTATADSAGDKSATDDVSPDGTGTTQGVLVAAAADAASAGATAAALLTEAVSATDSASAGGTAQTTTNVYDLSASDSADAGDSASAPGIFSVAASDSVTAGATAASAVPGGDTGALEDKIDALTVLVERLATDVAQARTFYVGGPDHNDFEQRMLLNNQNREEPKSVRIARQNELLMQMFKALVTQESTT